MRLLFILVLCLQSNYGFAIDSNHSQESESKALSVSADTSIQDEAATTADVSVVPEHESRKFKLLVSNLCRQINLGNEVLEESIGKRMENILLIYNGITRETKDYKQKLGAFLNKNKDHLICPKIIPNFRAQHIFTRVIDTNMSEEVLFKYLLHPSNADYNLDVNAVVEIVDGKKETVLDYIQRVKESDLYKVGGRFAARVNALERLLKLRHGAVLAKDLPDDS